MSSSRTLIGAALAAALLGGVGATAANAAFTDVDGESSFAEHITNVQESGIATGYPDGSFRPRDSINRQQAAMWIDRGSTRSALDFADEAQENQPVNPNDPLRRLATIEVHSPADAVGGGWVTLQGYAAAATRAVDGEGCPCAFDIRVLDGDGEVVAMSLLTAPGPESEDERPTAGPVGISPLTGMVWLQGGTTQTYTLEIELLDSDVGDVFVAGTLSGIYAPMGEGQLPSQGTQDATSLVPGP